MASYEPGKGRTFTPSLQAREWIDKFDQIMNDYNEQGIDMSRNRLTEMLIKDGIRMRNGQSDNKKGVFITCEELSDEQLQMLQSPGAQPLIKNLLLAISGQFLGGLNVVQNNLSEGTEDNVSPGPIVSEGDSKAPETPVQEASIHGVADLDEMESLLNKINI